MLKLFAFLPGVLLLASIPATAQSQPAQPNTQVQQQAQPNASQEPDPNRKICKTEELIGSRVGGSRVCKTAAQWEAQRKQAERSGDGE